MMGSVEFDGGELGGGGGLGGGEGGGGGNGGGEGKPTLGDEQERDILHLTGQASQSIVVCSFHERLLLYGN